MMQQWQILMGRTWRRMMPMPNLLLMMLLLQSRAPAAAADGLMILTPALSNVVLAC
jgi:hypothetical protein